MARRSEPPHREAATAAPAPLRRPSSLADVAALAGVSPGTVSRALGRPEMISEATRQRVLEAVDRLGYVANGAARALALRRTFSVGAVVPRFGGSSFPTLVQALESSLAAEGLTLLLSAPDHARSGDPGILHALLERGVDALALLGAEQPPQVFALLTAHRIPFVLLWAEGSTQGVCVGFSEAAAAALVVDHLADLGHRRLGFIGGRTAHNERARRRFRGVLEAVARRGLTLVPEATLETDYGFGEGFEATRALLAGPARFSALICGNDYLAGGALAALDQAGIDVPGTMSVASFNDNDFAAYLHPPLTTVHVPIREIGEVAARHLIDRLRGSAPAVPPLLPVSLRARASTGPAPNGRATARRKG